MSNEQEQFERLHLLLTIKRYEQPPPGFFNRLSGEIIAQIRAEQGKVASYQPSWLERFWGAFEAKPVFAGSFGVAVCGLALAGVAYFSAPGTEPVGGSPFSEPLVSISSARSGLSAQPQPVPVYAGGPMLLASTGQVISLAPSPVQRHPDAMTAGFR